MVRHRNAALAGGALLLMGAVVGCGSSPAGDATPSNSATVSINGTDTGSRYSVTCDKLDWLLTISSPDDTAGFTAMIDTDGDPDAKFVKIRDLGDFTGSSWEGGVGEARADIEGKTTTITGTGYGFFDAESYEPTTAEFTITAVC